MYFFSLQIPSCINNWAVTGSKSFSASANYVFSQQVPSCIMIVQLLGQYPFQHHLNIFFITDSLMYIQSGSYWFKILFSIVEICFLITDSLMYVWLGTETYLSPDFWGAKPKSLSQWAFCPNDFSITYVGIYVTYITNQYCFLGSRPKGPMSCRTQGWISRRLLAHPSVRLSIPPQSSGPLVPTE